MKYILYLFTFCLLHFGAVAQELNVNVTINTPKLQTADPKVFESLKTAIQEFYNNTKWTDDVVETLERISVNVTMTITEERSATEFKADFIIQASRPIYGTDQETVLLNHLDKDFTFAYEQFQPLQYTQNSFADNLTSILSFYAFIILGLDYDTFAPFGGEKQFQTAQEILNNVPQTITRNNPGWRSVEGSRNRYWMIENILTPRVQPLRQALYDYHRQGLDKMHEEAVAGRTVIAQALETIATVDRNYPNSMIIQMLANAKSQEIIDLFAPAPSGERFKVADIMTRLDPANANRYRILRS